MRQTRKAQITGEELAALRELMATEFPHLKRCKIKRYYRRRVTVRFYLGGFRRMVRSTPHTLVDKVIAIA